LEVAVGSPLYVTGIVPETNTVMLGTFEELKKQELYVRNVNMVKYESITKEMEALTKIRYKDPGTMSTLKMEDGRWKMEDGRRMKIVFHAPVTAVAPGQSAVFYEGDDLIGGGFIDKQSA